MDSPTFASQVRALYQQILEGWNWRNAAAMAAPFAEDAEPLPAILPRRMWPRSERCASSPRRPPPSEQMPAWCRQGDRTLSPVLCDRECTSLRLTWPPKECKTMDKRCWVSPRIASRTVEPEDVTQVTGLHPSGRHHKGDQRYNPGNEKPRTGWEAHTRQTGGGMCLIVGVLGLASSPHVLRTCAFGSAPLRG